MMKPKLTSQHYKIKRLPQKKPTSYFETLVSVFLKRWGTGTHKHEIFETKKKNFLKTFLSLQRYMVLLNKKYLKHLTICKGNFSWLFQIYFSNQEY